MSDGYSAGAERVYHIPLCRNGTSPHDIIDNLGDAFERQMALYDILEKYAERDDHAAFSLIPIMPHLNPEIWNGGWREGFETYESPILSIIPHDPSLFRNVLKEIAKDQSVQELLAPLRDAPSPQR